MKVLAVPLTRFALHDRSQHVLYRPRYERRTKHEDVSAGLLPQGTPEVVREIQDGGLILAAVRRGGCPDADQRQLRVTHGPHDVCRHGHAAALGHSLHELDHAFFNDGCLAATDQLELRLVDVHADDGMPIPRETGQ